MGASLAANAIRLFGWNAHVLEWDAQLVPGERSLWLDIIRVRWSDSLLTVAQCNIHSIAQIQTPVGWFMEVRLGPMRFGYRNMGLGIAWERNLI